MNLLLNALITFFIIYAFCAFVSGVREFLTTQESECIKAGKELVK